MKLQKYTYNKKIYTVDYRLQQFRTINRDKTTSFLNWKGYDYSELADKILCKMIKDNVLDYSLTNL